MLSSLGAHIPEAGEILSGDFFLPNVLFIYFFILLANTQ